MVDSWAGGAGADEAVRQHERSVMTPERDAPAEVVSTVEAVIIGIKNPRVEGYERAWATLMLNAVPDGWAKVDGEWVRITSDGVGYGEFDRVG